METRTEAGGQFLTAQRPAVALLVLFAAGALLRFAHMDDVTDRTPDEGRYTSCAREIQSKGLRDMPLLVRAYNQDPQWHDADVPPTRVGYLALLAGVMTVTGVTDERAGAWLSCAASLASLALLGVMAFRFLPPWPAIYSMLYLAISCPDLAIARRSWQDAVMGTLGLVLVWSACGIVRDHRAWWIYLIFIGVGSFFPLMKELGAFVYGWCALYIVVLLFRRRAWRPLAGLVVGGLAGATLTCVCLILGAGGSGPLLEAWQHLSECQRYAPYSAYQSGPWYFLIAGLFVYSPVNVVLSMFALGLALLPERYLARWQLPFGSMDLSRLRLFSWMSATVVITLVILPNSQSLRFLAAVFGSMYLMGGFGLWAFWRLASRYIPGAYSRGFAVLIAAVVVAGAVASYRDFERVFIERGITDLAIRTVLATRH